MYNHVHPPQGNLPLIRVRHETQTQGATALLPEVPALHQAAHPERFREARQAVAQAEVQVAEAAALQGAPRAEEDDKRSSVFNFN